MGRRGDGHRLIRWLWTSRRVDARLAGSALLPFSAVWRAGMAARNLAFDRGWMHGARVAAAGGRGRQSDRGRIGEDADRELDRGPLRCPRTGAGHSAARLRPGRGAGPPAPGARARVVADPDRMAGAERALAEGAQVLVLDDAFQRRDVWRDYNIAVVSAETSRAVRWSLRPGPGGRDSARSPGPMR